jgi:hypothetical protein
MRLIEQAKNTLPPEQSFLADLKRSIEIEDEKGWRLPSQTYKPSSMNCIRGMYYQIVGKEPDKGNASYCMVGICGSGSDIHVRVQTAIEHMKNNGFDCEYVDVAEYIKSRGLDYLQIREKSGMETKLYHKNLNMSFMTDGIIRYQNHYYVLELKTETCNKWYSREGVDPKHYAQGTAYSIAFNIPEVIFVYISRDNLDMKSFLFVPTDEMKENLVGKIEECDSYVKRLIAPPKPENADRKLCQFCGYKTQCRKDG